jgi:hypothetical protein
MDRRAFLIAAVVAAGSTSAAGSQATPASVWFGTWNADIAKSTYTGEPGYKRATYTIEPAPGDALTVIYDLVLPRGGVTHTEWTGRLDGKDYPVRGLDEYLTYAYRGRDDGSFEIVAKIDGHVAASSIVRFSADGRTMITVTSSRGGGRAITTKTVYQKQ